MSPEQELLAKPNRVVVSTGEQLEAEIRKRLEKNNPTEE